MCVKLNPQASIFISELYSILQPVKFICINLTKLKIIKMHITLYYASTFTDYIFVRDVHYHSGLQPEIFIRIT